MDGALVGFALGLLVGGGVAALVASALFRSQRGDLQHLREAFQALAGDALSQNNRAFLDLARASLGELTKDASHDLETRQEAIDALVKPIGDSLARVDARLHEIEKERHGHYSELVTQLKSVSAAHERLHAETANLVKALRAPSVRGRWGEIQLKRVVEMAGMLEHCDFTEQETLTVEGGRLRPDLIVRLPGGKRVVVDAKAPLQAYLDALEANDDATREARMKDHARQVREHMASLGSKSYWEQFDASPEFVVMFLPGETFFGAALQYDPGLIEYGVDQGVIAASPTTLIALLRAVAYGWRQEKIAESARAISDLGRALYERIGRLAEHFTRLGKRLDGAVDAYNDAVGSLESRVLVSARRFAEMGAGTSDPVPELEGIERAVRETRAPELRALPGGPAPGAR